MGGFADLPNGSELVGVTAGNFECSGDVILTIAHPSSADRIFHALRPEEGVPRPMEMVSERLKKEPFYSLETGQGPVYVAANALGPDTLERMAKAGKLAQGYGSYQIGVVKVEEVPDKPARGSWAFVRLTNRAGGPPVVEGNQGTASTRPPVRELVERVEAKAGDAELHGLSCEDLVCGHDGKPQGEFPEWLKGRLGKSLPVQSGSAEATGLVLPSEGISVSGDPQSAQRPSKQNQKSPVMVTMPSSGSASWGRGKKPKALKRARKEFVASRTTPSEGWSLPEVGLLTGLAAVIVGLVSFLGVVWLRAHSQITDVRGYYRWERDELQREIQERRKRYEIAMQQHSDLRELEREDRELGDLNRVAGVLDERSR